MLEVVLSARCSVRGCVVGWLGARSVRYVVCGIEWVVSEGYVTREIAVSDKEKISFTTVTYIKEKCT